MCLIESGINLGGGGVSSQPTKVLRDMRMSHHFLGKLLCKCGTLNILVQYQTVSCLHICTMFKDQTY